MVRVINGAGKTLALSGVPALEGVLLDLGTADLLVREGDLAAVEALLKAARDGTPRWQGGGIGTSAATNVTGLVAVQQGSDVWVKLGYNGDTNLDGRVNADDYFRIDQGFLAQPQAPTYRDGDFNYDDRINADDYFLIDQAFLGQGTPLAGDVPVENTAMASAVALPMPTETEEKVVRKRTVRPLFSDEPVLATRSSRRSPAARGR